MYDVLGYFAPLTDTLNRDDYIKVLLDIRKQINRKSVFIASDKQAEALALMLMENVNCDNLVNLVSNLNSTKIYKLFIHLC